MRRKPVIYDNQMCACYHCEGFFRARDIKEYCDDGDTILCPKCSIDSVLIVKEVIDEFGVIMDEDLLHRLSVMMFYVAGWSH